MERKLSYSWDIDLTDEELRLILEFEVADDLLSSLKLLIVGIPSILEL